MGKNNTPNAVVDVFGIDDSLRSSMVFDSVTACDTHARSLRNDIYYNPGMSLILGGDHRVSFRSVSAQIDKFGPNGFGFVLVDMNTNVSDLRSVLGHTLDVRNIVYIGTRGLSKLEERVVRDMGFLMYTIDDVARHGVSHIMNKVLYEDLAHVNNIHVSFDVDVMGAPCTESKIQNGGLLHNEVIQIARSVRDDGRLESMDVIGFSPILDGVHNGPRIKTCGDVVMATFTCI